MNLKKAYNYLFYKLYMLFEDEQFHWMREWRVYGIIVMLNISIIFSLLLYYEIFIDNTFEISQSIWILIILIVGVLNYIYFHSKDQWRKFVKEFEKYSRKKNRKGTIIVYTLILLIIINLVYSFYLYYQIP